jgi:hypothetical protein
MGNPIEADSTGTATAVAGYCSDFGDGVFGSSNTGIGVHGVNNQGSTPDGDGPGVEATACGVFGESYSNEGVFGASALQHGVHGVNGQASGLSPIYGCGVWGDAAGCYGVYGSSQTRDGVHGESASTGVSGVAGINSGGGHGIYGRSTGYAGFFDGNVNVNGDVTVNGNVNVTGDVILTNPGSDCAEQFDLKPSEIADPGTVMVIDDTGALRRSYRSYDRAVAGVVSGAGDYRPAIVLDQQADSEARTTM